MTRYVSHYANFEDEPFQLARSRVQAMHMFDLGAFERAQARRRREVALAEQQARFREEMLQRAWLRSKLPPGSGLHFRARGRLRLVPAYRQRPRSLLRRLWSALFGGGR